jgi:phosphatidylglycerol:prolipoprotein diacylglycerol transferase
MRPVLFTWRGWRVWSYPALLYVGVVFGLLVGNVEANLRGLDGTRVYLASLLLLLAALTGARLAYVIGHWQLFREDPRSIWRHSVGGLAMYGGLVAVPLSVPLLAALDVPFWAFWDVAVFTMLTGMVFTRVGCLLNGCCVGRPTESRFGLILRDRAGTAKRRLPSQLLEAGLGATVLGAVATIPIDAPPGTAFLAGLAGYALGRILLQGTREEHHRVAGLRSQRAASVAFAAVAIVLLAVSMSKI